MCVAFLFFIKNKIKSTSNFFIFQWSTTFTSTVQYSSLAIYSFRYSGIYCCMNDGSTHFLSWGVHGGKRKKSNIGYLPIYSWKKSICFSHECEGSFVWEIGSRRSCRPMTAKESHRPHIIQNTKYLRSMGAPHPPGMLFSLFRTLLSLPMKSPSNGVECGNTGLLPRELHLPVPSVLAIFGSCDAELLIATWDVRTNLCIST